MLEECKVQIQVRGGSVKDCIVLRFLYSDEVIRRGVEISVGGAVHDLEAPVGRLLLNVFVVVAEFEADLIRARTREGMKIARAKGMLRGREPTLSPKIEAHLVAGHRGGNYAVGELAAELHVARSTVDRADARAVSRRSRAAG
ncbi:hypothetical protein C5C11_13190 [Rathayibacter rathayi]|nr:hypothetical protein C5C11_13190 [Rathayibacter rathayi]